jgi:hypothetical protein
LHLRHLQPAIRRRAREGRIHVIDASDLVTTVLAGPAFQLTVSVSSWRDGTLLAADVPVVAAAEEGDRSLRVPERVTFTVPREMGGVSWAPHGDVEHPLASNGQRLSVKLGVGTTAGQLEYVQRGWFLIDSADVSGDSVEVVAVGLLHLVDEARLVTPYQPSGTLSTTLRGLIEPGLSVDLTDAPTDRAVPAGVNYDEDRLGAVLELADAWAAELVVTEGGYVAVEPSATPSAAVATLSDSGSAAVVIRQTGSSSRDGGFNVVVARGTAADGGQVQAVAYDTSSPRAYGSAWSPYAVPYFFSSPLLTSLSDCSAAAKTVLRRLLRGAGAEYTIEMVPNPLLQCGDPVTLATARFSGLATIEKLTLPYRISSGDHRQSLVVREVIA